MMKDWRQVEKLFGAFLELEPAERLVYLSRSAAKTKPCDGS